MDGGEVGEAALLGVRVASEFHCIACGEDYVVGAAWVVVFAGDEDCADAEVCWAGWGLFGEGDAFLDVDCVNGWVRHCGDGCSVVGMAVWKGLR